MKPTKEQQLAIDIRDANVLVSAAAGSGKTSVLVERIISRITSMTDPVDVDRLLVMTFTNAAAAEMQDRIRDAIDAATAELSKDENADRDRLENLEKQSLLVHNARITTIHGFCKSVITEHFEKVSLDPNFRVADESECKMIKQDTLAECLEKAYEAKDADFLAASECFSAAKNDSEFEKLIIPIYEFISADPDPEGYARSCCGLYEYASFDDFTKSGLVSWIETHLLDRIKRFETYAQDALDIIDMHEELAPYKAAMEAYHTGLSRIEEKALKTGGSIYDKIREGLNDFSAPSFGSVRKDGLDDDTLCAKDVVTRLRDEIKSGIGDMQEMLPFDLKTTYDHVVSAAPRLRALIETVIEFGRIYDEKKRANSLIDFNDMEHLAARILEDPDIAAIYREQFVEIYVDEYQDTNKTQEHLVNLICRKDPGNVFRVGDVKQSIYAFRQACPDIFLEKYNSYSDDEGAADRRILLNDNFRSRSEVTDAVNEVFAKIMKAKVGGIEYDDDAKLKPSATCYEEAPSENDPYKSEIILGENAELSEEEMCANIIATRITAMIRDGFRIYDKEAKITRPASYGDFTILVRSIKKYEPVFREVFRAAGIPLAVTGKEGYFGTVEVQTALAFLSAVDNPLCDIPLASLMLSPVGGFSDTDMACIAAKEGSKICLYDRIKAFAGKGPGGTEDKAKSGDNTKPADKTEKEIRDKCINILKLLERYRVMSTYTPVHGVLSDFIDREYAGFVKCMNKGAQRMANLEMLLAKAEDFGRTNFKGLYRFVRYMDQIQKYEIDDGEAGTVGESDDVVRLMTMHSSKGLEFPVCFVCGINKRRNTMDESGAVLRNRKYGFGVDSYDLDRRTISPTLPKIVVKLANRLESVAEEMRILYVAMTRARDKLIMVGCGDKNSFTGLAKDPALFLSYLDMLRAAYGDTGFKYTDISIVTEEELVEDRLTEELEKESAADELLAIVREYRREDGTSDNAASAGTGEDESRCKGEEPLPDYLSRVSIPYPHPLHPELRAKLSVTDLKRMELKGVIEEDSETEPKRKRRLPDTDRDDYIPKFMRKEGESATGGTFYGTAFHRIMELWEYPIAEGAATGATGTGGNDSVSAEDVTSFAEKMHEKHRMDRDQVDAIDAEDVAFFLNCPLGIKMRDAKAAGTLRREQPFVIGIPESGETILVQGIIDAYFIEDDGITIVDYKTDRVNDARVLVDRYRKQLEYYGMALTQITGRPIKALTIYSTRLRRAVVIEEKV